MIEVRCFSSLEEAGSLRKDINALNMASVQPDPFSTFEFFENYFYNDEDFPAGQGMRLWFLTAFLDKNLVGYVVLKQVTRNVLGIPTSALGFFVTHDTDRPHLVAKKEHQTQVSEAFYSYLLARKHEWSLLEFQQQDSRSALFPSPASVNLKGYLVRQWPSLENGTLHMRWNKLHSFLKDLSPKSRSNITRQMRKLLADGEVQYLVSSDPAVTPILFELYRRIELHSWKTQAKANIGRHPHRITYFKGLLDARQPMCISIHIFLFNGIPVAGLINGAFMQGLYALNIIYDDRFNKLAPGSAAFLMGIRQAIEGQYTFYNLLSGFGYYKLRWLADLTETHVVQIYRKGGLLFWHRILGDFKRRLLSAKPKQGPVLYNPTRRNVAQQNVRLLYDKNSELIVSVEERDHVNALIRKARKCGSEFFSAEELSALMPFETRKPAVRQRS